MQYSVQKSCQWFRIVIIMNSRIIFHVDMDAFFASVEILHNPELKGKAVIVGGNPDKRGVVSTCSYEARKYGVRSAMPLSEAKRRCPHGIFIDGHYSLYREYSDKVMLILSKWVPCIEIVGIDEAYLDATEVAAEHEGAFKLGQLLRREIFKETALTCSVGIGSNKLIAKVSSSMAKPNGLYEVPGGYEMEFLGPLAIEVLPGIGAKTRINLNHDGIYKVKDLQNLGMEKLVHLYGASGYYFWNAAMGRDSRIVESEDRAPKSVGAEMTFDTDQKEREVLLDALMQMKTKALRRMHRNNMRARGVSLKLRFSDFRTITRSCTFDTHTNEADAIEYAIIQIFNREWDGLSPLRLIGVTLEKLSDSYWQPTLWDWQKEQEIRTPISWIRSRLP